MRKKIILYTLVALVCFSITPFITFFLGAKYRKSCFIEISYRVLFDKLTNDCGVDSTRALRIYEFVINNISVPQQNFQSRDENPFDIILDGFGYCDQQANALISLAGMAGIKGNLIFLYGSDSISRHSVCELKIKDKYIMFDPFYDQLFLTINNNLASIDDIQNGNIKYPQDSSSIPKRYFRLFEKKYPYKIFMTNKISFSKRVVRNFIDGWCNIFGEVLLKPYLFLYFIWDNSNERERNKIKKLLY